MVRLLLNKRGRLEIYIFYVNHFIIFCLVLFVRKKTSALVWGGPYFSFILFLTYAPCFIGFELDVTNFQMMEIFFRFCDYNAGEA